MKVGRGLGNQAGFKQRFQGPLMSKSRCLLIQFPTFRVKYSKTIGCFNTEGYCERQKHFATFAIRNSLLTLL